MTTPTIRMPYLVTSRQWPEDGDLFRQELNKAYTEIALGVNNRTIGIFDKFEIVTGEAWYNDSAPQKRRQSYRQVYTFTNVAPGATKTIPHGLKTINQVTRYWAEAITDVPDFRQIPYVSVTNVTDQIEMLVDNTNITIINGATSKTLTSGFAVLEYILTS